MIQRQLELPNPLHVLILGQLLSLSHPHPQLDKSLIDEPPIDFDLHYILCVIGISVNIIFTARRMRYAKGKIGILHFYWCKEKILDTHIDFVI